MNVEATLRVLFGQGMVLNGCSVMIEVVETNISLFELYPKVFSAMGSTFPYKFLTKTRLSSALLLPSLPNSEDSVFLKVSVLFNGITYTSSSLAINVRYCDSGQILVGALDSTFGRYRCVNCYAGTYANYRQLNGTGFAMLELMPAVEN